MKVFATFGRKGDEWRLVEGPNADYKGQAERVKKAREEGPGGGLNQLVLVDIKAGIRKRTRYFEITKTAKKKAANTENDS